MNRQLDAKIAKYIGLDVIEDSEDAGKFRYYLKDQKVLSMAVPYYTTEDNHAISLLSFLVEKGYSPNLFWCRNYEWNLEIWWLERGGANKIVGKGHNTIAFAISDAFAKFIDYNSANKQ